MSTRRDKTSIWCLIGFKERDAQIIFWKDSIQNKLQAHPKLLDLHLSLNTLWPVRWRTHTTSGGSRGPGQRPGCRLATLQSQRWVQPLRWGPHPGGQTDCPQYRQAACCGHDQSRPAAPPEAGLWGPACRGWGPRSAMQGRVVSLALGKNLSPLDALPLGQESKPAGTIETCSLRLNSMVEVIRRAAYFTPPPPPPPVTLDNQGACMGGAQSSAAGAQCLDPVGAVQRSDPLQRVAIARRVPVVARGPGATVSACARARAGICA